MSSDAIWLVAGLLIGWFLSDWKNRSALWASGRVNEATNLATSRILAAAENEAKLAGNVVTLTEGVNELEQRLGSHLERLSNVVDAMDRNQGAILSGLINSGVIRAVSGGGSIVGPQVGEEPFTTTRPPRVDRVVPLGEVSEPLLR